jgi:membrane-associated phospholipid phosphatase
VNLLIQALLQKDRPIPEFYRDELILKYIPQNAFPSDHAALSFAIATTTILYALKRKNKNLLVIGIILATASGIMSASRVALGAHRPTDILMGFAVAIGVSYLLTRDHLYTRSKKNIFTPIIQLEKWFWKKYFKIDQ